MNVIVVVIDTLRYDHVGANGNESISTPNLDRLAAESWCFDRCFVTSFPTIPHRLDVITGRSGSPFHPWAPLPHDAPTLPRAFADAGYCTQLIHDTPHLVNGGHNFDWPFHAWTFVRGAEVDRPLVGAPLDPSAGPAEHWPANWAHDPLFDFAGEDVKLWQGTSTYLWANRGRKDDEDWNAAKLFKTAAKWLEDNAARERFFLWVDCFDPHEPWDAPSEFVLKYDSTPGYDGRVDPRSFTLRNHAELSEGAARRMKAFYAAKVSWMDRWLGEFLDALEQSGLSKSSALILTADHGTNLRERGKFGKGTPVREGEGHVPLFIRVPGGEHGHSSAFVQPQDIFGTAAALAGIEAPEGVESQDVLAVAREGSSGARAYAVSGTAAGKWMAKGPGTLFTVFGPEHYLEFTLAPSGSVLTRYGSTEDCAASNPALVEEMRAAGLDEIESRGTASELVDWLRGRGEGGFPGECRLHDNWPGPAGFRPYFTRLYNDPGA